MNIWSPNTTTEQLLELRIRSVYGDALPLTCSIKYGSSDRWVTGSVLCSTASYDYRDILNLSASIDMPYNELYAIEVYQVSASNTEYRKIYQGELLATTASATIRTSEPFVSYNSASTEYIIYE
jgi:hypothetical protein